MFLEHIICPALVTMRRDAIVFLVRSLGTKQFRVEMMRCRRKKERSDMEARQSRFESLMQVGLPRRGRRVNEQTELRETSVGHTVTLVS